MNNHPEILAKPDVPLYQHLQEVSDICVIFAKEWKLNQNIARNGGILHDIGKSCPRFQFQLIATTKLDYYIRHELVSLAFLPLFPKSHWDKLIDMVVAHHKSIKVISGDRDHGKGLLDIVDYKSTTPQFLEEYLKDWSEWSPIAIDILESFGIKPRKITLKTAKHALNYTIKYTRKLRNGCSDYRGLLMAADHYASALKEDSVDISKKLFKIPNISFYEKRINDDLFPLSKVSTHSSKRHTLLISPTGSGKTDWITRRTKGGRIIWTLPYQASINSMWKRFSNDVHAYDKDADIRLLHASSALHPDLEREEVSLQRLVGASIKITTPFQLASILIGTAGYESMKLDIKNCDVVFDEPHTYENVSHSMLLKMIQLCINLNCRVHLCTATMPTALKKRILKILGGTKNTYVVTLPDNELVKFDRHIIHKVDSDDWQSILANEINCKNRVLFVCNQVRRSQLIFEKIKSLYPALKVMLIHSRFKRGDRTIKEKILVEEFEQMHGPCVVVTTQVIEVSLDISFDSMLTEEAPLSNIIQRIGRVNRRRNVGILKSIYVLKLDNDYIKHLPYDISFVQQSTNVLPEGVLHETDIQSLIDIVYPKLLPPTDIDLHDISINKIKKLSNKPKSSLIQALEIWGASCILDVDVKEYIEGNARKRQFFEIPMSWISFQGYLKNNNPQKLEAGNWPYVVPSSLYSSEKGLML